MRVSQLLSAVTMSGLMGTTSVIATAEPDPARVRATLELVEQRLPRTGAIEIVLDSVTPRSFFKAVYHYDAATRAFYRVHHKFIIGRDDTGRPFTGSVEEPALLWGEHEWSIPISPELLVLALPGAMLAELRPFQNRITRIEVNRLGGFDVELTSPGGFWMIEKLPNSKAIVDREEKATILRIDGDGLLRAIADSWESIESAEWFEYQVERPGGFDVRTGASVQAAKGRAELGVSGATARPPADFTDASLLRVMNSAGTTSPTRWITRPDQMTNPRFPESTPGPKGRSPLQVGLIGAGAALVLVGGWAWYRQRGC